MLEHTRRTLRTAVVLTFLLSFALLGAEAGAQGASRITVIEKEHSITVSRTNVPAGTYTLDVRNNGKRRHDLVVAGPGVDTRTPALAPGARTELQVTLRRDTYALWCSIDDHQRRGMRAAISVN